MNWSVLYKIPENVKEAFAESYIKADKVMLVLIFAQWMAAVLFSSHTYNTYWYGLFSGGIIFGVNFLLYQKFRGTQLMRLVVAVSMMLFSLIYIQQQLGRIEMHFHVFIALGILTIYKDVFPIIVASITTIVHHALFNVLQLYDIHLFGMPVMIFNYGCGWNIVLLHGFFAVMEAAVLVYITRIQIKRFCQLVEAKLQLSMENYHAVENAKEAEEFLHALTESNIVSKTNPMGFITYVNEKFCEISGYGIEELIGRSHNIVRHPDMDPKVFEKLWKTIQDKRVFKGLIKNRKKNGDTYYVDTTIIPILNMDDEIVEYIASRYDVTELVVARDKAQLAEIAKDNFLANMSHELRTPLNAIIGFTKMVYNKVYQEDIRELLETSLEASDRLLELINSILDTSKIKSGKFTVSAYPFDLEENMQYLIATMRSTCERKSITCNNHIDIDRTTQLNGDWHRISQIIVNLISNATKFTPEHGHIDIHTSYKNGIFSCSVKDNGIGMSEEAKRRVFLAFEQADQSTTREYGGTGLGLSISIELAHMMHGDITVESTEGEGSLFTLTLPLDECLECDIEPKKNYAEAFHPDTKLTGRILIAEDDKTNQLLIRLLLEDMGLECDIANNGLEAVEMYEEHKYDLVLMDHNMPKMSGVEAMQKIRRSYINVVPIIALTANSMKGDKEKFIEAGMDDFLAKPIDDKLLYEMLKKYLK